MHPPSLSQQAVETKTMATPSPTPLLFILFLPFLFFSTTKNAKVPANQTVQTFTYVNHGSLGPYLTEYNAGYRPLPVATAPFQLCFYNTTPGAFYLALHMGSGRPATLRRSIWEANRAHPVRENATLTLRRNGNLVLADADRRVVWSTKTANRSVAGLKILPNGNMVLYNARGRFVWQSFDHPTDTLLVGQSLRAGGATKLVSQAYRLVMGRGGLAMYVNNKGFAEPLPYYNYSDGVLGFEGRVKSVRFEYEPELGDKLVYDLKLEAMTTLTNSSSVILARPKYNATLSFLRLEKDGNLVVYTYYNEEWERTFAFFSGEDGVLSGCALPRKCGAMGVCEDEMCVACPTAKGLMGWSRGCRPPRLGVCGKRAGEDYYKVVGVESFLTNYGRAEVGVGVGLEECRKRCSGDCRCVGFLYWEDEPKCWLAPLIGTLSKVASSSHMAYIKYIK